MQDSPTAKVGVSEVLVPLDGSELAAAAMPTARAAAARFGADLTTISVAADEREAEALRRSATDALGGSVDDDRTVVLIDPDPAGAITRHAGQLDALIVMSTRGRGRVAGAFLGSVARSVVSSSGAPVLLVGPNADRPGARVGRPRRRPDSWPEPLSVGSVLAAVDGTPQSELVLPLAARWAEALDRDLVVFTVAEDAPARVNGTRPNRFGPQDPQGYVDALASTVRGERPALKRVVGHVTLDPIGVASGLTRYLSDHPTALVSLATPVRSGLDRLRLGATAADMVRNATAPTLVVRSDTSAARDVAQLSERWRAKNATSRVGRARQSSATG